MVEKRTKIYKSELTRQILLKIYPAMETEVEILNPFTPREH